jgi:uncharacterized protein YukE
MSVLLIDYSSVASSVSEIKGTINNSGIVGEYDTLLSAFTESKGDEAKAIKALVKADKAMVEELNDTLNKILDSILTAAEEFSQLDTQNANHINKGGVTIQASR